jgi:hypothetical protein
LEELGPVDAAVAEVGFDFVHDGDVLKVDAAVFEGKRRSAEEEKPGRRRKRTGKE